MRNWIQRDLLTICTVAALTPSMALLFDFDGNSVQAVIGILFIFYAPGYAVVSILMPAAHIPGVETNRTKPTEVSFIERSLLAVGLSVAIVPSIGVILHFSPLGLDPDIFLLVIGILTLLASIGAIIRRERLQRSQQFKIRSLSYMFGGVLTSARSDKEAYLNIIFAVGIILAIAGIGTAVAMSDNGERFTEFYIQSEDPDSVEQVAGEYPPNMTISGEYEFTVGITNQEHNTEEYAVVVQLQRMEDGEVVETSQIDQFTTTVAHGETVKRPVTVQPEMTGENFRLSYQLYRGSPPEDLSVDAAYRHVYLWVNISATDGV
ncbi:DUF1616 domain-containing protein [Halovenus sp. HT40]|uniref:DUF1616 domain-containing protein n=1 Tax=Halovenus sp. HT40 TaxID=3126691 RepID=UPI00300E81B6